MILRIFKLFTVTFFLLTIFACKDESWAHKDLQFMYDSIVFNHPGMFNTKDKFFAERAKSEFEKAKYKLSMVTSKKDKQKVLEKFVKSFDDTHLGVGWFDNQLKENSSEILDQDFSLNIYDDIVWIKIPTFMIDGSQLANFEKIVSDVAFLKNVKAIVFDVRGNRGGNSLFGSRLLSSLFGYDFYSYYKQIKESKVIVDWRASSSNYEYLKRLQDQFINKFGSESDEYIWIKSIVDGVEQAIKNNEYFYSEINKTFINDSKPASSVTAKIFVLIDKKCGSACLGFIDELYAMDYPITLIGEKTNCDSLYMELRSENLPSKLGIFYFPIKVYSNRSRGNNIPYYPDIKVDIQDDNKIQEVITKAIKSF